MTTTTTTTTTTAPTWSSTNALSSDVLGGFLCMQDGMLYYVTNCCGASGKGSVNMPSGVCCRACYKDVGAVYGDCWQVESDADMARYADRLRPHLGEFADKIAASVREAARRRMAG